ncbi:MAG TPA: hypothetical protein VHB46_12645 [Burkholderiales bacterium]|nr:hypothetical protein [Burkholderiales bacterium]
MQPKEIRTASRLIALGTLSLAASMAGAIENPRVMFVSGTDVKPVIVDLQGHEIPAKKGVIIEPGFTVKVPEGATVQIMTPEKGIIAVRPDSLLKFEGVGDVARPYRLKLDNGGLRVANSEKNSRKYELVTPNAKIRFDKGDNEAYYLKNGKLKDGRWGTFVRGLKDGDVVLAMPRGDVKVARSDVGYVPGTGKGDKVTMIARIDASGKPVGNPVSYVPGAKEIGTTEMVQNFQAINDKTVVTDTSTGVRTIDVPKSDPVMMSMPTQSKSLVITDPAPVITTVGLDKGILPSVKTLTDTKIITNPTPITLATAIDDQGRKTPAIVKPDLSVVIPSTVKDNVVTIAPNAVKVAPPPSSTTTTTTTSPGTTTIKNPTITTKLLTTIR